MAYRALAHSEERRRMVGAIPAQAGHPEFCSAPQQVRGFDSLLLTTVVYWPQSTVSVEQPVGAKDILRDPIHLLPKQLPIISDVPVSCEERSSLQVLSGKRGIEPVQLCTNRTLSPQVATNAIAEEPEEHGGTGKMEKKEATPVDGSSRAFVESTNKRAAHSEPDQAEVGPQVLPCEVWPVKSPAVDEETWMPVISMTSMSPFPIGEEPTPLRIAV